MLSAWAGRRVIDGIRPLLAINAFDDPIIDGCELGSF
jgi:hypothetical protein